MVGQASENGNRCECESGSGSDAAFKRPLRGGSEISGVIHHSSLHLQLLAMKFLLWQLVGVARAARVL